MDDPMFLWAARHLQSHPLDPYGFWVNWSGIAQTMSAAICHPPATSYYLALAGRLLGWTELALHLAFLLPAIAAVLGTYALARQLCEEPVWAALATLLTPTVLVCSTSVMADILMLAFWVWAVALWLRGIDRGEWGALVGAALCITGGALTKLYALSLLSLLCVYALARKRALGGWTLCLAIPVIVLAGYQWATQMLYERGFLQDILLLRAAGAQEHYAISLASRGIIGLAFVGGCLITAGGYAPWLWPRRAIVGGLVLGLLIMCALAQATSVGGHAVRDAHGVRWALVAQWGVLAVLGLHVLALAVADVWDRRDSHAVLLLLWVVGIVVWACFLNWTVNGRVLLTLAPATGILIMRRLERRRATAGRSRRAGRFAWPLVPALIVSLLVTVGDYAWANTARAAAATILGTYGRPHGTLWFQGHWGFQYYMQAGGGTAFDRQRTRLATGDLLVLPLNNTGVALPLRPDQWGVVEVLRLPSSRWVSTMHDATGAGFHAAALGPLPFVLGPSPVEEYYIVALR